MVLSQGDRAGASTSGQRAKVRPRAPHLGLRWGPSARPKPARRSNPAERGRAVRGERRMATASPPRCSTRGEGTRLRTTGWCMHLVPQEGKIHGSCRTSGAEPNSEAGAADGDAAAAAAPCAASMVCSAESAVVEQLGRAAPTTLCKASRGARGRPRYRPVVAALGAATEGGDTAGWSVNGHGRRGPGPGPGPAPGAAPASGSGGLGLNLNLVLAAGLGFGSGVALPLAPPAPGTQAGKRRARGPRPHNLDPTRGGTRLRAARAPASPEMVVLGSSRFGVLSSSVMSTVRPIEISSAFALAGNGRRKTPSVCKALPRTSRSRVSGPRESRNLFRMGGQLVPMGVECDSQRAEALPCEAIEGKFAAEGPTRGHNKIPDPVPLRSCGL